MSDNEATPKSEWFFRGLLAVAFPLGMLSHFLHWPDTATFFICAVAILPLAHYIGHATEALSHRVGSGIGGLLNATFGNAAELILALAALRAGKVHVVKASLTGSILANLLLIIGLSMLVGGYKRERQKFNPTGALAGASMMYLALAALGMADFYHAAGGAAAAANVLPLSIGISVVMLAVYFLSLLFTIKTHAHLYTDEAEVVEGHHWTPGVAAGIMLASTAATAVMAEFLVHAVEGASVRLGLTHTFVGVIVVAVVGNAAEHSSAVAMAHKDKMNLAFNIAVESSKQIALFVAPLLVLASLVVGPAPMDLEFSHLEVGGMALSVGALTLTAMDGESNWLEGVMLLALYGILGAAFYFTGP